MTPTTIRHMTDDFANDRRPTAQIVPLVRMDGRRTRREASGSAGPFGQILLFTGVRYERMSDVEAAPETAMPQRRHS